MRGDGMIVNRELKARALVTASGFAALRALAEACGDRGENLARKLIAKNNHTRYCPMMDKERYGPLICQQNAQHVQNPPVRVIERGTLTPTSVPLAGFVYWRLLRPHAKPQTGPAIGEAEVVAEHGIVLGLHPDLQAVCAPGATSISTLVKE
jgi:hypothetical protein